MKKMIYLLILILWVSRSQSQINLEHTFETNNIENQLLYINLGNDNYKYVIVDYLNSKFHIYNLDYTPFLVDVNTALSLQENDIAYISSTLFDCDDSTIEYVLIEGFNDFKVYNTSGENLFFKDDVVAIFCYGCNNASTELKPIYNTPSGTKLVLRDKITNDTLIYGLCGTLPLGVNELTETGSSIVVYPVPANRNENIHFKINIPDYVNEGKIEIYDMKMNLLDSFSIQQGASTIARDANFSSGSYFYAVKNAGRVINTGKFIIE